MVNRKQVESVRTALSDTPIVMIVGPRQCGKSTLARSADPAREYVTFDDLATLGFAKSDPVEFLRSYPGPITIDEVQRVPELFLPLKAEVDRDRKPGKYLLTGSANVLHMPKIGDSLAGRIEIVNLLPFSQGEFTDEPDGFVDALFGTDFVPSKFSYDTDLFERVIRGGYPEPSLRKDPTRRSAWFESYVASILDRDIRDIANIDALAQMPRLFSLLAARTGTVLNANSLALEMQIPYTSLKRYLDLLEMIYLLHRVPAWSSTNRGKSFTKAPKLYMVDTGLLAHLANHDAKSLASEPERRGPVIENFVAMELKKQTTFGKVKPWLVHLRTVRNYEVDFVLENKRLEVAGVEVKSTKSLKATDADGLKFLKEVAGENFRRGVILYHGEDIVRFASDIVGVPIQTLWSTPTP